MSAQDILKMIEEVDPNDTAKLNEIDFAVWQFLGNDKNAKSPIECGFDFGGIKYTRSRDALKAIRPHQGASLVRIMNSDSWDTWKAQIAFYPNETAKFFTSPNLPTEELAELHAIIQAIDFERTK